MAEIGLIVHRERAEALTAASELTQWITQMGHNVYMTADEASAVGCSGTAVDPQDFSEALDLVVTLGGDGSILRAVELTGECGVPILGVNFGRMGYLTEVGPHQARDAVKRVLDGDHEIEQRMLLTVEIEVADHEHSDHEHSDHEHSDGEHSDGEHSDHEPSGTGQPRRVALNEAVVERRAASYAMRLGVSINGEHFTTYAADGLIVATPTGSTAYAMSARGPVIDPTHRAILLTPVSPHMLFDRSMVVDADTTLRLEVLDDRGVVVSIDGRRQAELSEHDAVVCSASPHPVRLVTFGARRFHQVLKSKFGLNDR